MTCQARYEKAKELKLCFCCLAGKHVVKDCTYKACGVKGCSRRHHPLLHREANERQDESRSEDPQHRAEANSAFRSLKSSGIRPVIPVIIQVRKRQESTLTLWESGASQSFIDKKLADKLNAHGEEVDLCVAGIHGTNDVKCERFTVGIRGKARSDTPHDSLHAPKHRRRIKDLQLSRAQTCLFSFVGSKRRNIEAQRCKMILGQNCYHIHRPEEYRSGTDGEPWAVKTKLGWTLCGPLPPQEAVQMTASCVTAS